MSRASAEAARDLIAIALETLRADLLPNIPADKRYTALMIANALAIAERELRDGDDARRTMRDALAELLGAPDSAPAAGATLDAEIEALQRKLVHAIEQGAFDAPERAAGSLMPCLGALVRARLRISRGKG
jgi:tRNA C32,U32 (ribose-2'-O)-methylase TrmJ